MKLLRGLLLAAGLLLVMASPASSEFEDWSYETPVVVNTAADGSSLSERWIAVEDVHARALHSQSFLRSDAQDLRMSTSLGEEIPLFAQNLNGDDSTWWFRAPTIANDPTTYYMHMGRPSAARDQAIGLDEGDSLTVADDASLDIDARLSLESLGTRIDAMPAGTGWLIRKPGAYGLGVRTSGDELEAFGEIVTGESTTQVTSQTGTALPNAAGSQTSARVEASGCDTGRKWECVDDPAGAPDADTYLHTADLTVTTTHTAAALPDGDGAVDSARIAANNCTNKWECVDDPPAEPDTSTYLSAVDMTTTTPASRNMLPNAAGAHSATGIVAQGCANKYDCVDDAIGSPDTNTYLLTRGVATSGSPAMLPDSAGALDDAAITATGCTNKWECVDDPPATPDTNTYLATRGLPNSATGTATMRPDSSAFSPTGVTVVGCGSVARSYECIDEATASDADYIRLFDGREGTFTATVSYHLPAVTIPDGATITSVTIEARMRTSNATSRCRWLGRLRNTGVSPQYDLRPEFSGPTSNYNTWQRYTATPATGPNGRAWTASDLDDMQVGFLKLRSSVTCDISQVFVTVTYTYTPTDNPLKSVSFGLAAPPVIPSGGVISHVTTHFRYTNNISPNAGTCDIRSFLRLGSTNLDGVASVNANPRAATDVSGSSTTKPGGGRWAAGDLTNLQVGVTMRTLARPESALCAVTQLYVTVHYSGGTIPVNTISFGLTNPSVPGTASISSIAVHFRYSDASQPSAGTCEISASLRSGGADLSTAPASVNANPSTWSNVSGTSAARPDGNPWTPTDMSGLEIVLSMRTLGGSAAGQCRVTQLYAVVDYSTTAEDTAIHSITFALGNPVIPANAVIDKVSTSFRYDHAGASTGSCRIWSTLRLGRDLLDSVASVSANPESWTDVTGETAAKPGGGAWQRTDLPGLEVGLRMRAVGPGTCQVTQVFAVVHYSVTALDTETHAINFLVSVPAIPSTAAIQKVVTTFRYTSSGASAGNCLISSTLTIGDTSLNSVSTVAARPTEWTDVTGETTTKPGGGNWTTTDLGLLELGLRMRTIGAGLNCQVTQLNATVHYTVTEMVPASVEAVSYKPLSVGTEYDIQFVHDGSNLQLYIDGVSQDRNDMAPAIPVTSSDVVIGGGWKGSVKRSRVGTVAANQTYRDRSGSANTLTAGSGAEAPRPMMHGAGAFASFDQYLTFADAYLDGGSGSSPRWDAIDNLFAGGGTVEFCARLPDDGSRGDEAYLLSKGSGWGVYWTTEQGGRLAFVQSYASADGVWLFPALGAGYESWHCYAVAYNRDQAPDSLAMYVDGVAVTATVSTTRAGTPTDDAGTSLRVGRGANDVDSQSNMDEIRLWSDLRTAEEIGDNWQSPIGFPGTAGHLAGYWDLDDPATDTKLDLQYEPPHVTETQKGGTGNAWNWLGVVDDQSGQGNSATYMFLRDTSVATVNKRGLSIKQLTSPGGLDIPDPDHTVRPIDVDIGTGTSRGLGIPVLGVVVQLLSETAGIHHSLVWTIMLLFVATLTLLGVVAITGEPISAMAAAGIVLAFGAMTNVLPWPILIIYVIMAAGVSAVTLRRP